MAEDTTVQNTGTQSPDNNDIPELESIEIPENYKDTPVGKYRNIGELFKGYGEAQKLIGAKGVIIPGEKDAPEKWDGFYNSLGRPEKPDGYKLSPIENLHPELKITPEVETGFKALAHKHGLTGKQADGLYKEYFGMISGSLVKRDEKMTADKHAAETALRTEWGGDYDTKLNKTKRLIDKFGGSGGREVFGELGNNPKALKILAAIADKFSEDGFIKGEQVTNSETKEAQIKINNIMMDSKHPYWVAGPGHAEAVTEMKRLQSIVHPEVEV
jgi:hypothetical protein